MYTVSFRIPLGPILGTNTYVNGSYLSASPATKGEDVAVRPAGSRNFISLSLGEVIESVYTSRTDGHKWERVS